MGSKQSIISQKSNLPSKVFDLKRSLGAFYQELWAILFFLKTRKLGNLMVKPPWKNARRIYYRERLLSPTETVSLKKNVSKNNDLSLKNVINIKSPKMTPKHL